MGHILISLLSTTHVFQHCALRTSNACLPLFLVMDVIPYSPKNKVNRQSQRPGICKWILPYNSEAILFAKVVLILAFCFFLSNGFHKKSATQLKYPKPIFLKLKMPLDAHRCIALANKMEKYRLFSSKYRFNLPLSAIHKVADRTSMFITHLSQPNIKWLTGRAWL